MNTIATILIQRIDRLRQATKPKRFAVILGMVLLIGILDYLSGDQLDLSVLYLPLVALTVWVAGLRTALWMAMISSTLWLVDDFVIPQHPLPDFYKYWQTAMRFIVFAAFAEIIGQLRGALEREQTQARRDALTGLLNVRGFHEAANTELARSFRHRRPLAIAFIDCDNFKQVNDRLGHSTGNELLAEVGRSLLATTRGSDLVARMGGDEFVLLFSELDARAARQAVEKSLAQLAIVMREHDWPVTFSVGLASFATPPGSVDELVRTADDLMYEAKRAGRNTVRSLDIEGACEELAPALAC